jgi:MFS family permease
MRGVRAVTNSRGAGESGLGRVLELHLVSTAADTLIVTALASTIFFAVPTEEARSRVATSLLVTMVPFIVLAPLIGPLLDRFRRGRRYALMTTMVVRAFLAWVMAGAVSGADSDEAAFSLYPAAFGFLVCQKAYLVTRAAAVPRVLPSGGGLVNANARISLAGVAAMTVAAPLGAGLTAWVGPEWTLRLAFGVFAAGTALALVLPPSVDVAEGEMEARISRAVEPDGRPGSWSVGPHVVLGLRANATLRAFTGFLTLFLAFRLRTEPLPGVGTGTAVALVVVMAGVGGGLGTVLGSMLRRVRPEVVVVAAVVAASASATWAALQYGMLPVLEVALMAGLVQSLGKLCLDALIQREIPERVRTSAFARSETVLQFAWVAGGGIGLVLPLSGSWGMAVAALGTAGAAAATATDLRHLLRADRASSRESLRRRQAGSQPAGEAQEASQEASQEP